MATANQSIQKPWLPLVAPPLGATCACPDHPGHASIDNQDGPQPQSPQASSQPGSAAPRPAGCSLQAKPGSVLPLAPVPSAACGSTSKSRLPLQPTWAGAMFGVEAPRECGYLLGMPCISESLARASLG